MNAEESSRTTPDNSVASSDTPDKPRPVQLQAAIESEVYEFRERTMWWPEGEITKEIARLATRGAMEIRDRELEQLRAKVAEFDHIINWHTTCASCARILDSAYQETVRAEKAEAALAVLRKEQDEYEETVVGDLNETVIGLARQAARAEAAIARVRAALAAFDGRGVIRIGGGNLDIPTAGEVLDAVRAALEEPEERPRTTANNPATSSDSGPSVADCRRDDRRWDLQREGE